jgi:hypothetical protein
MFSRIMPYCMFKNLKQIARKQTPKFLSTGINAIFCQKQLYFRLENVSILWILLLWLSQLIRVILPMLEAAVQPHLPSSIISTCKSQFIAAQIESMKMSNPLAGCFDRIEFKGTLEQRRRKAIIALVNNHCSLDTLLADEDIQATERCTATLVLERIKFRIQSLSVDYQFPQNCCFKRSNKKAKAWRITDEVVGEYDEEIASPPPESNRAKKYKTDESKDYYCVCIQATTSAGGSFCGNCGGFDDISLCCGVVVKTPFCTLCGLKKTKSSSSVAEAVVIDLLSTSSDDE